MPLSIRAAMRHPSVLRTHGSSGAGLVELLVALALFSVTAAGLAATLRAWTVARAEAAHYRAVLHDLRSQLDRRLAAGLAAARDTADEDTDELHEDGAVLRCAGPSCAVSDGAGSAGLVRDRSGLCPRICTARWTRTDGSEVLAHTALPARIEAPAH